MPAKRGHTDRQRKASVATRSCGPTRPKSGCSVVHVYLDATGSTHYAWAARTPGLGRLQRLTLPVVTPSRLLPKLPCEVRLISTTTHPEGEPDTAAMSYPVPPAHPVISEFRSDRYKRGFDLAIIALAHLLFFPIVLLVWTLIPLAIWLEDRGPIFYTQRRAGKGGRVFQLFKFRSMVKNAESSTGAIWAGTEDPRITRVGRFLRSRALDEVPQIINVWKGDLSLVGPRPERPELVARFVRETPAFARRLHVRPGLTGPAQVYGRYATKPRDKLRYDTLYIRTMSPWLDFKLLFMSVIVTLRAKWQARKR